MQEQSRPVDGDPAALLHALGDPERYLTFLDDDLDTETGGSPGASPPAGGAIGEGTDTGPADRRGRHPVLRAPGGSGRGGASGGRRSVEGGYRHYLEHSADLTFSGGLATAVAAPAAVCALAEQYAFRRIGGSSAAAVAAAATAAAELGRTAPAPARTAPPGSVRPGFPGLADTLAWLAALDPACDQGPDRTRPPDGGGRGPDGGTRLAALLRPGPATRDLTALLLALAAPGSRAAPRGVRVLATAIAGLDRLSRAVVGLLWAGAVLGCGGVVIALARSSSRAGLVVAVAGVPLAVTFGMAAALGTLLVLWRSARAGLDGALGAGGFGLVPGDALFTWVADRLDDLAGVPVAPDGAERYALTFGELWLGRMGTRAGADLDLLRRAAVDPQRRVIDLALVTTDLSGGRPRLLPLGAVDRPEQHVGRSFLFCRDCLGGLLPGRVVDQLVLMAPAADRPPPCPRHHDAVLQHLPAPWDLPVAFAVRLAAAGPGLLAAVPLYRLHLPGANRAEDPGEDPVADPGADPAEGQVRVHWFGDGALAGGLPVHAFDEPLPRWPTFSLSAGPSTGGAGTAAPDEGDPDDAEVVVPELGAAEQPSRWRPVDGGAGLAGAALAAVTGWRDALHGDLPGLGARLAVVRGEAPGTLLGDEEAIGRLAVRGHRAGCVLRERFAGPDAPGSAHTQTDRLRWVRLRTMLDEHRRLSLSIGVRVPLYCDLALAYRVPGPVGAWFSPPLTPGHVDPAWGDAVAAITHLRSLAEGGVLDWDTAWGAPPPDPHLRLG